MREEVDALAVDCVGKQNFGGEAGNGNGGVGEDLRALEERCLNGHEASSPDQRRPGGLRHLIGGDLAVLAALAL